MPYDLPTWVNGGPPTRNATNLNKYTTAIADLDDRVTAGAGALTQATADTLYSKIAVDTYANLPTSATNNEVRYVRGRTAVWDGGQGLFRADTSDTTTADNGGTVIVRTTLRWKRILQGWVDPAWFGFIPSASAATQTSAINTALALQMPTMIQPGDYTVNATVKPEKNRIILALGKVRIYGLRAGTFDECLPANGASTGKYCVVDLKNMHNTRMEGIQVWGAEDDPWIANRVCFGSTGELGTSESDYAGKMLVRCQAWRAEWAIYAPSSGITSFGFLTGFHFEHFECHTTNGIYGGSNQDDVSFTGLRLVNASGYGIYKVAGMPWNFDASIITCSGGSATAVHLEPGAILNFDTVFFESGDNTAFKPIMLNAATTSTGTSITINGMSVNGPDGIKYVECATQGNNQFVINGLRDKNWNGSRPNTKLVHMVFADATVQKNKGYIRYLGTDSIDLITFSSSDQQYNRNNLSVVTIESQSDIVTYKGVWWTLSMFDDPPLQRHTNLATATYGDRHVDNGPTQGMLISVASANTATLQGKMARPTLTNSRWFVIRHDVNSAGTLILQDNAVNASSIFNVGGANLTLVAGQEAWFQWNTTTGRLVRARQSA